MNRVNTRNGSSRDHSTINIVIVMIIIVVVVNVRLA